MISQTAAILQLVVFGAKRGEGGCFLLFGGFFLWVLFIPCPLFLPPSLLSFPFGFHFPLPFFPLVSLFSSIFPPFSPFRPSLPPTPLFFPPCFFYKTNKQTKKRKTTKRWALATRRGGTVGFIEPNLRDDPYFCNQFAGFLNLDEGFSGRREGRGRRRLEDCGGSAGGGGGGGGRASSVSAGSVTDDVSARGTDGAGRWITANKAGLSHASTTNLLSPPPRPACAYNQLFLAIVSLSVLKKKREKKKTKKTKNKKPTKNKKKKQKRSNLRKQRVF